MIQDDILETVSALEPRALRERADELSRRRREDVLERARAAGGRRAFLRAAADRRWRLPLTAGVLATAAAVAAGVFVYSPGRTVVPGEGDADVQNNGVAASGPADARELFAAAAEAAAAREADPEGFWYVRTRRHLVADPPGVLGEGEGEYTVRQTFTDESWWELGGEFRSLANLSLDTETEFPTEADESAWERDGSPELAFASPMSTAYRGERNTPYGVGVSGLAGLPEDAGALEEVLREQWTANRRGGEPEGVPPVEPTEEDFRASMVHDFPALATSPVSGPTLGALFTLAGEIEGIRLVGPARDPLDREGYEVEVVNPASSDEGREGSVRWIIDPEGGALLSEQWGEHAWTAYEEVGAVDEIGDPAVPVEYEDW